MDWLLEFLLTQILLHGYPIIALSILGAYLGAPVPLNLIILAAGAFSVDEVLNIWILIFLATFLAVLGDCGGYFLGKKYGKNFTDTVFSFLRIRSELREFSDAKVQKWGLSFVFLTRWLISPLGIPVNIFSGMNMIPFKSFLIVATLGELLWASLYAGLGFFVGAHWVDFAEYIKEVPNLLALLVLGAGLLFFGKRIWAEAKKRGAF